MTEMSRRAVLATAAAATLLPTASFAQAPILKRKVPQTGFMLPVIGIGTSRVFEFENDPAALAERKQVVQALVAGGGSLIDTAAGYGTAEANVGTVSAETNLRSKLFLATKFSSRARVRRSSCSRFAYAVISTPSTFSIARNGRASPVFVSTPAS